MASVTISAGREDLIRHFLRDCRKFDRREWEEALVGSSLEQSMWLAMRRTGGISRAAFSGLDGQFLGMWGAYPATDDPKVGCIWFAARDCATEYVHGFHHHAAAELNILHASFPTLVALSDWRQRHHHKWLLWMGFTRGPNVAISPEYTAYSFTRRVRP